MIQINLLPWREQARHAKQIRFLVILIAFIGLTLFILLALHIYLNALISNQQSINTYLQTVITQEQTALASLNKEKKSLAAIDSQLHFIISLRNNSFHAVRLLNELTKVLPEEITLNKIVREENIITLFGAAKSGLDITHLMKNIAQSAIFTQPVLTEISSEKNDIESEKYFQLKIEQRE